ncbi:MAG: dihydroorotate dehydrogenase electron transfer subunit [Thermodesulfovibrionales bacterium]|nr:dihydroorotate dehydrogenase electron transfer subunit [Thermodesulfovibrionales bacterium]
MSKYFPAKTVENISLNSNFHIIVLKPLLEIRQPKAGQFYMLQAGDNLDPLLKRPFSILDYDDELLYFLFKKKGKGTIYLSRINKGDVITLLGPLGNGWPAPQGEFIVIAGGIGIVPLMLLLKQHRNKAILFYGAKNENELLMLEEASKLVKEIYISTDDGSKGTRGLITEIFNDFLVSNSSCKDLTIYCCGSPPMLKAFSKLIREHNLSCYASVEEYMACGVGACLGCVVKVINEADSEGFHYKTVCKDGPIFNLKEIIWDQVF